MSVYLSVCLSLYLTTKTCRIFILKHSCYISGGGFIRILCKIAVLMAILIRISCVYFNIILQFKYNFNIILISLTSKSTAQ